jgi:hypothetical protein
VSEACRRFETEAFCREGAQDDGRQFCEVHVSAGGNNRTTCNAYCARFDAACIDGWNDGANRCTHAEQGGCQTAYNRQVCRCSR